jgi:endoglycosylceramidase
MRWLVCALALAGCTPDPPRWHVAGGFVRDPDGRAAILHGVNVAGAHRFKPYQSFHRAEDYRHARGDWGISVLRFIVTWAAIEPQRGVYDEAFIESVAERVRVAGEAGLLVVLDMHQDVFGEGFGFGGFPRWTCDEARYAAFEPREPWFASYLDDNVLACVDAFYASSGLRAASTAAWVKLAGRLAGAPNVIGFDVMNEPHWGSYSIFDFESDRLQPYYLEVVRAVRQVAPRWLAFLEPGASRNQGIPTSLVPFPVADVVYAPHSYNAEAEGGFGFDPKFRAKILENIRKLAGEARALDAALWIGEFGGTPEHAGYADYMDASYDGAGGAAAGSAYWEWARGGSYAIQDASGADRPDVIDLLARPHPERVAGDPISYGFDRKTATFTLSFTPAPLDAPTEIVVPPRFYPNGFQVECGGCDVEKQAGRVLVRTARREPLELRIRP